jgi:SRSO17 transposase
MVSPPTSGMCTAFSTAPNDGLIRQLVSVCQWFSRMSYSFSASAEIGCTARWVSTPPTGWA